MTTKYTYFLPVQPVQVCILPVQRTGGLVSGLAYVHGWCHLTIFAVAGALLVPYFCWFTEDHQATAPPSIAGVPVSHSMSHHVCLTICLFGFSLPSSVQHTSLPTSCCVFSCACKGDILYNIGVYTKYETSKMILMYGLIQTALSWEWLDNIII